MTIQDKQFLFKHFFSLLFFYTFVMQVVTLISAMGLLMMYRTRSAPGRDCEQRCERFANQFPERDWVEIDPGRSAVLRLGGPQGHLDFVAAYFPTVQPATAALTVIAGDFNWVTEDADRVALRTGFASGARDRDEEERHWRQVALQPFNLHELHQPAMTHRSGSAQSRLDRLYWNQDLSEQLDWDLFAAALEWQPELSHHHAVAAGRRLPSRVHSASRPVTAAAVQHEDFLHRVTLAHKESLETIESTAAPFLRLSLLKDAIRQVAEGISRELQTGHPDEATEDKVGLTMQFLSAVEGGHTGSISKCIERYPELAKLVGNPYSPELKQAGRLQAVRSHAVELARERAVEELQRFSDDLPSLDAGEAAARRGRNWRLISRLAPGRRQSIQAVMDPAGTGTGYASGPPSTAPGPDGLPFAAWKRFGPLAVNVLFAVQEQLSSPDAEEAIQRDYPGYNDSLMAFLPKTPTSESDDGTPQLAPADARPLSLVNADNRHLTSAVRHRLEPLFAEDISAEQRGFLSGRSTLADLIDVDEAMQATALTCEDGAAIFFDLAAAFPSVGQDFLLDVLADSGVPARPLRYLQSLYFHDRCRLVIGGDEHEGFPVTARVRQGCPLSPLLYAIAADLLLRRLGRALPGAVRRAHADDVAVATRDGAKAAATLEHLFDEYAWAPAAALRGLPLLGFPARLPELPAAALAAKYRVCQFEAAAEGGLRAAARATELRATRLHSTAPPARLGRWSNWFNSSFLLQLDAAQSYFHQRALGPRQVALAAGTADPARLMKAWQRTRGPPRALAACLRTLWTGWVTARRFQQRAGCCFGRADGEDSVEHCADCPCVAAAAADLLGLPLLASREARLAGPLIPAPPHSEQTAPQLRRRALLTASVHLTHCRCRHAAGRSPAACLSALRVTIRQFL
ncbi:unnamed protein product [Prorocentrum cordatum]|uniref:Reverse transcriptase domain-containing protein n=1 Tax=Prorocentrum cordatum TaxID=2364126 RepID=A0ABN9VGD4_9DINO|nr:unnamed protein product [Polarella glacialis]